MNTFEHDGAAVAYSIRGTGPAILFLHNGGASSTIWRHQVAELSAGFRTVTVDLPGFGQAPRPERPLTLAGHVALLDALIDELDLDPVLIVGNCMGSMIALHLAATSPERTAGLVLVNPLTVHTFSAGRLGLLHKMHRLAPPLRGATRAVARRIVPPRPAATAALRFQLGANGIKRGLHHDPALLALQHRHDQLPALVDVLEDMDAYRPAERVRAGVAHVPVWTIWGAQNRVLSPRAGQELNERLQPERSVTLEGCGHLPMLEYPEIVTEIIEAAAVAHPAAPGDLAEAGKQR